MQKLKRFDLPECYQRIDMTWRLKLDHYLEHIIGSVRRFDIYSNFVSVNQEHIKIGIGWKIWIAFLYHTIIRI